MKIFLPQKAQREETQRPQRISLRSPWSTPGSPLRLFILINQKYKE